MSQFLIKGGNTLSGNWRVQGMKNAATPILAATLLTRERCVIRNIPRISDLEHMLAILEDLGAAIEWLDDHTISIQTKTITKSKMDYLLTKRMRSSVLFIGPILATMGTVTMPEPGGCNIGNRPLDTHFSALEDMGAVIEKEETYYTISGDKLQGGTITLKERSVTATENAMMAASLIPETTILNNVAREPHVVNLAAFLEQMGVEVSGAGSDAITIHGKKKLHGAEIDIIPDQLEIGTIAVLAALCGDDMRIGPVVPEDMEVILDQLRCAGVDVTEDGTSWIVRNSREALKPFTVETAPYPGFPTDLQAPFGMLATQAPGSSTVIDGMYENRLGYFEELIKMGADAKVIDAHRAVVKGPTPLSGQEINSLDLRAGATLIIAALSARGETLLHEAENIDRGYEFVDERLRLIGADITRID